MVDDEKLVELLVHRDELLELGHEATPEQVCHDCPELIEVFKERLQSLKQTDWLFNIEDAAHGESRAEDLSLITPSSEFDLPDSTLTSHEFLVAIAESGLMTAQEVELLQKAVSTEAARSSHTLARELIHQEKLTRYQASVLLAERRDPLLLDRYIILDTIDSGGMGVVFKAMHRSLERIVALKTLPPFAVDSPEKVKRFQREAKTAAMLSHPNIVTTHDAHESNGVHFLVMEYVNGKDLGKLVRLIGPLPVYQAVDCVFQAAHGLAHAHDENIVHRDIKPGNLLLDRSGTIKILDLGLARLDAPATATRITEDELTEVNRFMGTVAYVSPEQATDPHSADARSDIYSLGCTLHFLLTGEPPYQEDTPIKTILAHQGKPIPPLGRSREDLPEGLIAVYRRMMAKNPQDRYQSMHEVVKALSALDDEGILITRGEIRLGPEANPAPLESSVLREGRKSWWWIVAAIVVTLCLVQIVRSFWPERGGAVVDGNGKPTQSASRELRGRPDSDSSSPVASTDHAVAVADAPPVSEPLRRAEGLDSLSSSPHWSARSVAGNDVGGSTALGAKPPAIEADEPRAQWQPGPSLAFARHGLEVVLHAGDIYAVGGFEDEGEVGRTTGGDKLEVLRAGTGQWRRLASLPIPQPGLCGAAVGEKIYTFGSYGAFNPNICQIYDISTGVWQRGPDIPDRLYWATAQAVGTRIYVMGGYHPHRGLHDSVHILDTETGSWEEGPSLPEPIQVPASATLGDAVYVFGDSKYSRLDLASNSWSAFIGPVSKRGDGAAAVAVEQEIYLLGGNGWLVYDVYRDTEIFEPSTEDWRAGPPLTVGRQQFGAVYLATEKAVYVVGGRDDQGKSTASVEVLQVDLPEDRDRGVIAPSMH